MPRIEIWLLLQLFTTQDDEARFRAALQKLPDDMVEDVILLSRDENFRGLTEIAAEGDTHVFIDDYVDMLGYTGKARFARRSLKRALLNFGVTVHEAPIQEILDEPQWGGLQLHRVLSSDSVSGDRRRGKASVYLVKGLSMLKFYVSRQKKDDRFLSGLVGQQMLTREVVDKVLQEGGDRPLPEVNQAAHRSDVGPQSQNWRLFRSVGEGFFATCNVADKTNGREKEFLSHGFAKFEDMGRDVRNKEALFKAMQGALKKSELWKSDFCVINVRNRQVYYIRPTEEKDLWRLIEKSPFDCPAQKWLQSVWSFIRQMQGPESRYSATSDDDDDSEVEIDCNGVVARVESVVPSSSSHKPPSSSAHQCPPSSSPSKKSKNSTSSNARAVVVPDTPIPENPTVNAIVKNLLFEEANKARKGKKINRLSLKGRPSARKIVPCITLSPSLCPHMILERVQPVPSTSRQAETETGDTSPKKAKTMEDPVSIRCIMHSHVWPYVCIFSQSFWVDHLLHHHSLHFLHHVLGYRAL